ncbi:MAG: hypothetical protein A4S12_05200 [Proteobacteria bacterium SG_bin5]|nr:rhomboid family intramembrane serine protease [Sphingomonas sp.]OQW43266.1 MAG: hypothetical protein A4S12_05200 [Proteobacteria bacterium SG_bin5]
MTPRPGLPIPATATNIIAVATVAISALLILTNAVGAAGVALGFVPQAVTQPVQAPPGLFLLPVWLTPLSATLVHAGWTHLLLNLVMLVYCGQQVERAIGPRLLALLYVGGAYAAALGQWALGPTSLTPTIGASGAASALIAAYSLFYAERPVPAIGPIPSRVVRIAWLAAAWIGIQTLYGFAAGIGGSSIAIGAHIGGFVAGLLLARPLLMWRYRRA